MPALSPTEILEKKERSIPEPVFTAFNELIAENLRDGRALIKVAEIATRVRIKMEEAGTPCGRTEMFHKGWLDVEPIYRKSGWNVKFESSDMFDDSEPYYVFQAQ